MNLDNIEEETLTNSDLTWEKLNSCSVDNDCILIKTDYSTGCGDSGWRPINKEVTYDMEKLNTFLKKGQDDFIKLQSLGDTCAHIKVTKFYENDIPICTKDYMCSAKSKE